MTKMFTKFEPAIRLLPLKPKYEKQNLITSNFLIKEENDLKMYFSPHNEYINVHAKVVIIGITPGWFQMEKAIRLCRMYLENDMPTYEILRLVKRECRFAGAMRRNLIQMLEELGLHQYLNIEHAENLFQLTDEALHTVSLLKYPIFHNGRNYTGHQPPILHFMEEIDKTIQTDILSLSNPLIIPLGKAVETVLNVYIKDGILSEEQCLVGFPHPSGANGHRHKQFENEKEQLKVQIQRFFN
ncbi:hypothetical protein [Bacillus suaedaesalsae]|uniref:Uracil-DNA glycosylase-like domain-containing protein n=1 Tax=Bacillus suaedaesalsae TaxID=2810349 RepID=A0ABS2DEI7_9BACI|nr:hypothetical protein [Bacillus suaedaesalsae]MBM6616869.1 hypothetical protein [Bacillus suaedaesalsae]